MRLPLTLVRTLVIPAAFLAVLLLPLLASADHGGFHLVPQCPDRIVKEVQPDGSAKEVFRVKNVCTACDIFGLVQGVLNFLWWDVSIPLATLMIIYGGFQMLLPGLGGAASAHEKGKKVLTNTVIGILIVFFAWLAIDTIIKSLSEGEFVKKFGPWNKIECKAPETTKVIKQPVKPSTGPASSPGLDELIARYELTSADITVRPSCPAGQTTNCVNLAGIQPGVVEGLKRLKSACSCPIEVTGGTEQGHKEKEGAKSHAAGQKVDVGKNDLLDKYIRGTATPLGTRNDGAVLYRGLDGVTFADERNHWDIVGWAQIYRR